MSDLASTPAAARATRQAWLPVAAIALIAALAMAGGYVVCGASFGLLIWGTTVCLCGGLALSTLQAPLLHQWAVSAVVAVAVVITPAIAFRDMPAAVLQSALFYCALVALMTSAVGACGRWLAPALARLMVGLLAIAWVMLPIWAASLMTTPRFSFLVDELLPCHPLIALNAAFLVLGEWAHQPFAYKWLTNLGQDVPYAMPASAARGIIAHFLAAIGMTAIQWFRLRRSWSRP